MELPLIDAGGFTWSQLALCSTHLDTITAANEVGIRAGFSFYGGTNLPGSIDPFDIRRVAFESYTPAARVRLATALMAVTGTRWM